MTTSSARPAWAQRIQTERERRGWSKPKMARELLRGSGIQRKDTTSLTRQILSWETGEHFPRDWSAAYAAAFEVNEADLFHNAIRPDVDETRRHLLACLGVLGAERSLHAEALDPIRRAVAGALGTDHSVEDWEEIAFEYGHAFLTRPPAELLSDLAADLAGLHDALQAARTDGIRRGLAAPAGKLSALMAMTTSAMGDNRHARDWWATARHAADASSDLDLQVWVRGYEAMNALYAQRPLVVVLRRADEAIALGAGSSVSVMEALAARAQALAVQGRESDAESALDALKTRFGRVREGTAEDRLATDVWPETALTHTIAYVHTRTGNTAEASHAQDQALALYPRAMRRQRAQIDLLRAQSLVIDGHVTEGVQHAEQAITRLAPDQRTNAIMRGAHLVLEAMPDSVSATPTAIGYRDLLALDTTR
ncbi:hypothetical protein GCM10027589_13850 [Actinocorallia lasiicapitis]